MSTSIYTDPFGALTQNWNTLLRVPHSGPAAAPRNGWQPPVDIAEHNDAYMIMADLPGVNPDDVTVSLNDDILKVAGKRPTVKESDEGPHYRRIERRYGNFERHFQMPADIDSDAIEARVEHGVLSIRIGKQPEVAPRNIKVQVN